MFELKWFSYFSFEILILSELHWGVFCLNLWKIYRTSFRSPYPKIVHIEVDFKIMNILSIQIFLRNIYFLYLKFTEIFLDFNLILAFHIQSAFRKCIYICMYIHNLLFKKSPTCLCIFQRNSSNESRTRVVLKMSYLSQSSPHLYFF